MTHCGKQEKFKCFNLALCIEEVCVIEYINQALIILVSSLDTRLCPLGIVINFTDAVGKTTLDVKTDQNPKVFILEFFIDFLETGEIEIANQKVGFIASGQDVINDFRQEFVLIGYQVLAHKDAAKKCFWGFISAFKFQI